MKGAAVLLAVLLAATACGDGESPVAAEPTPSPSTPSSSSSAAPSGSATPVRGGQAAAAILAEADLPAGWRYATGQQSLGVPEMCDVVLEPPALESFATQRFTVDFAGPFVIQHSFVSADEAAAAERMAQWAAAAATCTSWTTDGTELTVSAISDLPSVGTEFGAVHAEVTVDGVLQQRDYVAWRQGDRVSVLISYGPADLASHADLGAMVRAIAAR